LIGRFSNRVGAQFRLVRVTCTLDGQSVYNGPGGGSVEMFRRPPAPGAHTISIQAEYLGNSGGVFSYFEGYRFNVRASRAFTAGAEQPTHVTVTAVERGGALIDFKDRLALQVNVN
jgi:hypothetical protein